MEIQKLLHLPEGKTLERKRDISSPANIVKTLVAFANSAGGALVLGVEDNGEVVGVQSPLDEEERLCNIIADSIRPRLVPNVEMVSVAEKTLLVVEVFPSNNRPHWVGSEGPQSGVYVRLGSSNRQADPQLVEELRRGVQGTPFDTQPMVELTPEDLDQRALQETLGEHLALTESSLKTLKLLVPDQGKLVPSRGAILLFGRERTFHFPDAWVQCGRFIGTTKAQIFDHIEISNPLPEALENTLLFLKKHAMRGADFSQPRRRDVWSIPLEILREAIVNALVHSDYSQRGAPIRVAFFDDRIEVENPGILLPGLTVEEMKQGVSRIRNPVIARVFRELHLVEQWGSGVPRIFQQAEELGLPEPQIREMGLRFRLSVFFTAKTPHVREQVPVQVTEQVAKLLGFLEEKPLATGELMEYLGLKHRPTFRENYLEPARKMGLVQMTQPGSPRSPTQKYTLTQKGKKWRNKGSEG
ncbi:MAG TPA: helix-turn-helix domain-containing protein [Thermotogota bacterium]|nr:helix-turn-helix domain-containing protein [Thermotogota bacterium]